jgi:hypothetical protein
MAIISPLAYTIANGDPVDATPVESNFTQIVQDVNANAASVAGNASQEFLVATTTNPAGAVPLAQVQTQFAALNGSSSQNFAAAAITASSINAAATEAGLGFTPVQQGTGVGQLTNTVKIGWSGSRLKATVDVTDEGNIVFDAQALGGGGTSLGPNLASSRAVNTGYTNNTGRPLYLLAQISLTLGAAPSLGSAQLYISNIFVYETYIVNPFATNNTFYAGISAIIPIGCTYSINASSTLSPSVVSWFEY